MATVTDFRVACSAPDHRKFEQLEKLCKLPARWHSRTPRNCWQRLIGWTVQHEVNRVDGLLRGLDGDAIEQIAGWYRRGKRRGQFFSALFECKLLDATADGFQIHDYAHYQGWAINAPRRSYDERLRRKAAADAHTAALRLAAIAAETQLAGADNCDGECSVVIQNGTLNVPVRCTTEQSPAGLQHPEVPLSPAVPINPAVLPAVTPSRPISSVPVVPVVPAVPAVNRSSELIPPFDPPFELKAEKAGLLKKKSLAASLRDAWPAVPPCTEAAWIAEKILVEQRVPRAMVMRVLEWRACELQGDPLDIVFLRFVANALETVRKHPSVRDLAVYMHGKTGKGLKSEPAEWALIEAKTLISRWIKQLGDAVPKERLSRMDELLKNWSAK